VKIADLMKRKSQRVLVRVPSRLQKKLGLEVQGSVVRVVPGKATATVVVLVSRKGEYTFRPQDLSLV
jgi:hypothetical protein